MTLDVRSRANGPAVVASFAVWLLATTAVDAAPAIRTSETNRVPACVSPERLMDFLTNRHPNVDPRYRDVARWYKHWGDAWRIRWDYAFFQMLLETNYLKYRRGDGRRGDVHERQNNFAGIGATGGGVPGERFRDIKTGVHAQIQHLVAYSGERIAEPVARRTQEQQDGIIAGSRRLGRPVTFGDLARRWAADRQYAKSIDFVAGQFRASHCNGPATAENIDHVPRPKPARRPLRTFSAPSGLGGPKPQGLAGPESLPWDAPARVNETNQGQSEPPAAQPPPEPNTGKTSKSDTPWRTLWSRSTPPRSPARKEELQVKTPALSDQVAVPAPGQAVASEPPGTLVQAPAVARSGPSEPMQQTHADGAAPPSSTEFDAEPAALPHFRITPVQPPPSKLGGPIPLIANGPADAAPEQNPAGATAGCRLLTASYGGRKTLLVRAMHGGEMQLTALTVLDGFEKPMLDTYAKAGGKSLELLGEYPDQDEALAAGQKLCPGT